MAVSAGDAREMGLTRECITLTVGDLVYEVTKRVVLIGRSRQCDLVLTDPTYRAGMRNCDSAATII